MLQLSQFLLLLAWGSQVSLLVAIWLQLERIIGTDRLACLDQVLSVEMVAETDTLIGLLYQLWRFKFVRTRVGHAFDRVSHAGFHLRGFT